MYQDGTVFAIVALARMPGWLGRLACDPTRFSGGFSKIPPRD